MPSPESGPHQQTELKELHEILMEIVQEVPERERVVILMHYVADYSQDEIADFLEVPLTTIKKRLHDGKARIRRVVMEQLKAGVRSARAAHARTFHDAIALASACISGDRDTAGRLIRGNPKLVSSFGEVDQPHMRRINAHWGWTPLHLAAHYGHVEIVRLLVESGADMECSLLEGIAKLFQIIAAYGEPSRSRMPAKLKQ